MMAAEKASKQPKTEDQVEVVEEKMSHAKDDYKGEEEKEEGASHGAMLEMLECPVCLEYPRRRPIYTCSNGHVTCSNCITQIKGTCPTCRNKEIKPNTFVERMADKALAGVLVSCKFAHEGCLIRQAIGSVEHHEEICGHREVHCPAVHRGACNWFGSLSKVIAHVKEKGCIQVSSSHVEYGTLHHPLNCGI